MPNQTYEPDAVRAGLAGAGARRSDASGRQVPDTMGVMTNTKKGRVVRSPLYRFAVDGVIYTAEGERHSGSSVLCVTLHLGYPRERVLGWTETTRDPAKRVGDTIMETARNLLASINA